MEASIRELKAHLSEYVRRAAEGEDVKVSVHGRVVAKIVPVTASRDLASLGSEPGITWSGGKPAGVAEAETLVGGPALAEWVIEDRR
jgi:prevent-host-death family protein